MKDNAYCADAYRCFVHHLQGRIRSRYHPEYSGWLRQSTWNRREFGRMPEMIVRAETVADVVETVRFAERHRHPISVRAGTAMGAICCATTVSFWISPHCVNSRSNPGMPWRKWDRV
jgi:hypothetical protein